MVVTIDRLDRFPKTLRQQDQLLGCIPTSVQAVLTYHEGAPATIRYESDTRTLDESTILEIFRKRENPWKIGFSSVKGYVLDPYIGDRYVSAVEVKPDFGEWQNSVVELVANSIPPLISYAANSNSHIGAVVEAGERDFKIHDPAVGDFVTKSLKELSRIRRDDILQIRPR